MARNEKLEEEFNSQEISPEAIAKISPGNIDPEFRQALAKQLDGHLEDLENDEVREAICRWNQQYRDIINKGIARSDIVEISDMPLAANDDNFGDTNLDDDTQLAA